MSRGKPEGENACELEFENQGRAPHSGPEYDLIMATSADQAAMNKAAVAMLDVKEREWQFLEARELAV